jgi:hypothetical protein
MSSSVVTYILKDMSGVSRRNRRKTEDSIAISTSNSILPSFQSLSIPSKLRSTQNSDIHFNNHPEDPSHSLPPYLPQNKKRKEKSNPRNNHRSDRHSPQLSRVNSFPQSDSTRSHIEDTSSVQDTLPSLDSLSHQSIEKRSARQKPQMTSCAPQSPTKILFPTRPSSANGFRTPFHDVLARPGTGG